MSLKVGSKGDLVRNIQITLQEHGFDPGHVDGVFGDKTRIAVVKFQESRKLEPDGVVGSITLEELGIKAELPAPEMERKEFKALLLKNPNYFGSLKVSKFELVKKIIGNTKYEELKCIGYNPHLEQLEAVVFIKKEYGYSGDICSKGSPEYVRFYVDWNNDGKWADVGMASFTAYDIPHEKPLEYDVTLNLSPKEKLCTAENLPKVRAILSWNKPPEPDDPDYPPVWGNVVEAHIQIGTLKRKNILELLTEANLKLPEDLLATLDLTQPVSMLKPKELSLGEMKEIYKNKGVPAHRFCFSTVQKLLANPILANDLAKPGFAEVLGGEDIDLADMMDKLLKTEGDTHYEELKCIGFNPNNSSLAGVITAKLPYGYSGDLCKKGSYEHVAFWEWDEIEWMWIYLGTASVNVHDIKSIPKEGLQYSAFLPVDFSHRQRPCKNGASIVRIRAVLSWQKLPSTTDPNKIPKWGNRKETLIHVKPGHVSERPIPYIDGLGNMAVCDIDQDTGLATGKGVIADFPANDSPFGGTVAITGSILNAPKYVMEGSEQPVKYKVFVRPHDPTKTDSENPWQALSNTFTVKVQEQTGPGSLPKQKDVEQKIDPADGYYSYLEDIHGSAWRKYAVANVLARWHTGTQKGLWEIRIEAKKADGTIVPGGAMCDGITRSTVRLLLDNEIPYADITISGYQRDPDPIVHSGAECGKFMIGDVIYGKYTAKDEHFSRLILSVHPDPNPSLTGSTKPTPDPMGLTTYPDIPTEGLVDHKWKLDTKNMRACGYTVRIWTEDRTIVNSDSIGWKKSDYAGFCLEEAPEKEEK